MPQRILITRPKEEARLLQGKLFQMGLETMINPILGIKYDNRIRLSLEKYKAIIFTSSNGVRAFVRSHKERNIPIFTVGDASAQLAKVEGFKNIRSASGDISTLLTLIKKKFAPKFGQLLHISASQIAGDLVGNLEDHGFKVHREVLYTANVAKNLQSDTVVALKKAQIDAVLLYSPRTAITLIDLIKKEKLEKFCKKITIFCLSLSVAKAARELDWGGVEVSEQPNQLDLLKLLESWSSRGNTKKIIKP